MRDRFRSARRASRSVDAAWPSSGEARSCRRSSDLTQRRQVRRSPVGLRSAGFFRPHFGLSPAAFQAPSSFAPAAKRRRAVFTVVETGQARARGGCRRVGKAREVKDRLEGWGRFLRLQGELAAGLVRIIPVQENRSVCPRESSFAMGRRVNRVPSTVRLTLSFTSPTARPRRVRSSARRGRLSRTIPSRRPVRFDCGPTADQLQFDASRGRFREWPEPSRGRTGPAPGGLGPVPRRADRKAGGRSPDASRTSLLGPTFVLVPPMRPANRDFATEAFTPGGEPRFRGDTMNVPEDAADGWPVRAFDSSSATSRRNPPVSTP